MLQVLAILLLLIKEISSMSESEKERRILNLAPKHSQIVAEIAYDDSSTEKGVLRAASIVNSFELRIVNLQMREHLGFAFPLVLVSFLQYLLPQNTRNNSNHQKSQLCIQHSQSMATQEARLCKCHDIHYVLALDECNSSLCEISI